MTPKPRYRKYPAIEQELLKTRKKVMQMFGQQIPGMIKEAYQDLYVMPPKEPVHIEKEGKGKDNRGRQKHGYVDSDPTFEAAFAKGQAQKRRDFDRAVYMLTDGLVIHIGQALALLAGSKAPAEPEEDIYQLVDRAAPTVEGWTDRMYRRRLLTDEERKLKLQAQGEWKAAGIE